MNLKLHARVGGRVQGVGFRNYVQAQAVNLGVNGWVRNRWDGSVEVVAEGERKILDQFLGAIRRGPRGAYVSDLNFDWSDSQDDFSDFRILRTE